MYLEATEGLVNRLFDPEFVYDSFFRLLGKSVPSGLKFIGEYELGGRMIPEMDHLVISLFSS